MDNNKNNIKVSTHFKNTDFEIEKNTLNSTIAIIKFIFSISNKNHSLNIDIVQKGNFIIFTLINNLESKKCIDYKSFLEALKNTNKVLYNYEKIDSYIFFKILIETEIIN